MAKLEVQITARAINAAFDRVIKKAGGTKQLAEATGLCESTILAWRAFRSAPNLHSIRRKAEKYRAAILAIEQISGESFFSIFPDIPRETLRLLSKPRTAIRTVDIARIGKSVDSAAIAYRSEVEDELDRVACNDAINDAMSSLKDREKQVIVSRFGLDGSPEKTLEEVAKDVGVTKERIRQIEARAIRKLKDVNVSKKLSGYTSLIE